MDDYTAEELQIHYEASFRLRADLTVHWTIAIRVANNAKERSYRRYVKNLEDTGRQIDLAMGRIDVETTQFFSVLDDMVRSRKGRR